MTATGPFGMESLIKVQPRLYPPLGNPGDCGICSSPMAWFTVETFGGVERVSLCVQRDCENGPVQTATRMGWDFR